jgi:predicted nucleotidyltransferase
MPTYALPIPRKLIPLPASLEGLASLIRTWARTKPKLHRVFLFGSTLRGKPDASDLDLAVQYTVADQGFAFGSIMMDRKPWSDELCKITGLTIDLQLAHPQAAPNVWGYLREGCALVFERE